MDDEDVTILVEFAEKGGQEALVERSAAALDRAMEVIVGMARRVSGLKEALPAAFTEAQITFGVKLDYEVGRCWRRRGRRGVWW
ncbi:MAG: hypothetical protein Fur0021_09250 [Candidatus Promineifilaceae bacterium]